jgi:hypothetical protein
LKNDAEEGAAAGPVAPERSTNPRKVPHILNRYSLRRAASAAVAVTLSVAAGQAARADVIYAASTNNQLMSFDSATPGTLSVAASFSGFAPGESVAGLDFRPATNHLYAVSTASKLYQINTTTGVATPVSGNAFTPGLSGDAFGADFSPSTGLIRVVSDNGQNMRINADTGLVNNVEPSVFYAPGDMMAGNPTQVVDLAYNPVSPTTLYGIDSVLDILVRFDATNMGALHTIGFLGVNPTDIVGFDIGSNGTAYAAMNTPGGTQTGLYTINLSTGVATLVGNIGQGQLIIGDIAVTTVPAPGALALLGAAGLMATGRRRRA